MAAITFEVGHRTTHGFPLLIALLTAAMVGFAIEVSRPVQPAAQGAPPPEPPPVSEPIAATS